ncbi:uncharacterized protein LJ206_006124 isoform 2-T2 [Theristicus caerulescens]
MNSKQDEISDSKEENRARQVEATGAVLTGFSPSSYFTYGPSKLAIPVDQRLKRCQGLAEPSPTLGSEAVLSSGAAMSIFLHPGGTQHQAQQNPPGGNTGSQDDYTATSVISVMD